MTIEPQTPIIKLDSRVDSFHFVSSNVIPYNKTCVEDTENNLDKLFELRGGDFNLDALSKSLFRIAFLVTMANRSKPSEGFQPRQVNPTFDHRGQAGRDLRTDPLLDNPLNRNNPGQGSYKKTQQNHDGTLTKSQRRNLPWPDAVIIPEQDVVIRHGQARWKVKKHGHHFDIPSAQNSKGRFKIEVTPKNVQVFQEEFFRRK